MDQIKVHSRRMQKSIDGNRNLFVGYITAGYPDKEHFFHIIRECCRRGLPVLEIGFPSKDPYEDGAVIKKAHETVGTGLCHAMDFWRRLRAEVLVPIWLMGYREDLIDTEIYRDLAEEGLFDALVIPNMGVEDRIRLKSEMNGYGLDVVGFISSDDSFNEITKTIQEFPMIYQRLYSGPTGMRTSGNDYERLLDYGKMFHSNTIFAGFGISSGDRVRELIQNGFYGAIIGTEIMRKLNKSQEELYGFIDELSGIMDQAR